MKFQDIEKILEDDPRVQRYLAYFKDNTEREGNFSFPSNQLMAVDSLILIYPSLYRLRDKKNIEQYSSLHRIIEMELKKEPSPPMWKNANRLKAFIRLLDKIAHENKAKDLATGKNCDFIFRAIFSPYFNRNPNGCIALLRDAKLSCRNRVIKQIMRDLHLHYKDILKLGREIESWYK